MTSVVVTSDANYITTSPTSTYIVTDQSSSTTIVTGQMGPPGKTGDLTGAFMVVNRLAEIAGDPLAVQTAQQNLGLYNIDGGTFF